MLAFALALALQSFDAGLAALAQDRDDPVAELPRLRRDARALLEESHRLLDRAEYEKAVDAHRPRCSATGTVKR